MTAQRPLVVRYCGQTFGDVKDRDERPKHLTLGDFVTRGLRK